MLEEWKKVENYDYEISNLGNIRSLDRDNGHRGKILKPTINDKGYLYIQMSKNSKIRPGVIHRLVAIAFKPNPLNKRCVNHNDGNKLNNYSSNLEWSTHKENNDHAMELGLMIKAKGENVGSAKLTDEQVLEIRNKIGKNSRLTRHILAKEYNVTSQTIINIYKRKIWTHI